MGQDIQASEVHITAIEQVKRSGFGKQLVQNVHVVNLASGHINIGRNAAPQIQQRVQFHRALAAAGFPHGKSNRHKSMVVEQRVLSTEDSFYLQLA